ncbi:MAG: HNH endonuclease [Candidatus Poribacteria bacterium]|nr:HNH endonuclease [Candidatus Poribacteria bacterium]
MQDIRRSPEYQRWRREIRHRDKNTCRICAVQRNLHVHHIKPLEKYTEFATDLDNGITLCGNCHAFLSGKEENTNLQTITEAFTGQQDMQTAEQLKRLNGKFSAYLEDLLKSRDSDAVNNAVHKMFVHLQIYPDSLDQFLYLIEYILSSKKGLENQFARQVAIETLKNHPNNNKASEMLSKYETSCNYQDGKSAYLQGDYATALKKFEPLAESGHTESQHYLGVIYEEGRGVVKDAKAAIKWYLKAAQQGNKEARTRLDRIYGNRRVPSEQDISDQHRSDFDTVRRKLFLAKTIARLEAKGEDRTVIETAQLRSLQAPQRTDSQQKIYERMLTAFINAQVARLQANPERSVTENRILEALTAVQATGIPEEAFEQETPLTRQSFFQRLSLTGINLCLSTLETYDVRIEIKDNRFTFLDIERSSGSPASGSSGMSAPLNTIFSEAYSQLSGEVFLTQEDIPTLKAFLASIKADVFVNAPTVRARIKQKLDMAEQVFHEARREYMKLRVRLWNEEIKLWRDELELDGDKWDRKALSRKVSDREIIDYLHRELLSSISESNGVYSFEDLIYCYRQEMDTFFEALHRLEERTRIENTWQPKEERELDERLPESRLCGCNHCQITRDELDELLRESGWTHEDDEEVQKLNFTKQIEKLNEHPINQRAREILEELAPTYYEVNQELRPKITEDRKNIDIEYGISPWWGLDVIILLERAEISRLIDLENELRTLWTPEMESGWEELYDTLLMMDTLPVMSESEMSYHLIWLAEPLWEPDQQPKGVLDRLCGKHRPVCQELKQTTEDFRKLYGDEAVQVSQGSLSADIVTFLTEPNSEEAVNTLKRLLRTAATGMFQRYSPIFYPYM